MVRINGGDWHNAESSFLKKNRIHHRHAAHEEMADIEQRGNDAQDKAGPATGRAFGRVRLEQRPEWNQPPDRRNHPARRIDRCAVTHADQVMHGLPA